MTKAHSPRRSSYARAALACLATVSLAAPAVAQASPGLPSDSLATTLTSLSSLSSLSPGSSAHTGSSANDSSLPSPNRPPAIPATIRLGDEVVNEPGQHEYWAVQNVAHTEYAEAYSPAMGTDVPLLIARPEDPALRENAPTIYLLNGLDGGTGWFINSDAVEFYTSRGVNVVMPTSGAFSYYTNWIDGPNQWDTFLARELPEALEARLGANGKRAAMGVSMSATSVLSLAQMNPGTYDGIASISGCASTTSPLGKFGADQVFKTSPDGTTYEDVWGDPNGEYARQWDPMLNLEKLSPEYQGKDLQIFLSSPSGLAGNESLTTTNEIAPGDVETAFNYVVVGGLIDSTSNICSHVTDQRLLAKKIKHDTRFYPQGTHNWNSFKWAVGDSWPTMRRALQVER